MKTTKNQTFPATLIVSAVLSAMLSFNALADKTKPAAEKPLTVERAALETVTATVEAINYKTREVTLKTPDGQTVTFVAGKEIKRLKEVKVGDEVRADYYVSIAGELRAPTEEEKKTPFLVEKDKARAPKSQAPAGVEVHSYRVVATVVNLDLASQTVSLQGPRGNIGTIRAEHPENLQKLRLGDTVIVTYTEALAVSLQKTQPATQE